MTLYDPLHVLCHLGAIFDRIGIDYLVGGSVASSLLGTPRATQDADVVADLAAQHVVALCEALGEDYYADPDAITDAIRRRRSFNLIHLDTMLKIDVFVMKRDPLWVEEMRRRVHIAVTDEVTLPIATAEDIILQKLDWYRRGASISDRQWNDVLGVVKVRGDELDMAYLDRWAEPMGLTDLLERALASAQRPSISKRRGEIDED